MADDDMDVDQQPRVAAELFAGAPDLSEEQRAIRYIRYMRGGAYQERLAAVDGGDAAQQ